MIRTADPNAGLLASPARNLAAGLMFVAAVMVTSTACYCAAGWPLGDAIYMVIITVYTVGFNEVRPLDTPMLRGITIGTIVLGCTGVIFLTGALVQFITANQINQALGVRRMTKQIEKLSGHVIVCGFGRIGRQLARGLDAGGTPFIILERDETRAAQVRALGYLCLAGDATSETVLQEAGVMRARVLATVLPGDAANVFITLTARALNPAIQIIARGDEPSTESKLLQAGANTVVLPTHIGAERIAELVLYPKLVQLLRGTEEMVAFDRSLHALGLDMDVATAASGTQAVGMTVAALEQAARGSFFVVQLNRHHGDPIQRPDPDTRIEAGDGLVLIGRALGDRALFT